MKVDFVYQKVCERNGRKIARSNSDILNIQLRKVQLKLTKIIP